MCLKPFSMADAKFTLTFHHREKLLKKAAIVLKYRYTSSVQCRIIEF